MAAKFDKFLGKIRDWSSKASDISDSGAAGRDILSMATLAEIQSAVSGGISGTRNVNVPLTYGPLTIIPGNNPTVSLQFSFAHAGNVTTVSSLASSVQSNDYTYNRVFSAGSFLQVHPNLNITDAGALQRVMIYDMTPTVGGAYECILVVGLGYVNNILSIRKL